MVIEGSDFSWSDIYICEYIEYSYLCKTHILKNDNVAYMNVNTNINSEILFGLGSTLK